MRSRILNALPILMCFIVGGTSFILSYVAQKDVATATGAVPASLAWAVPVCIDGGVLAASAIIWNSAATQKKRDILAFLTVIVLLATSVVINVSHAGDDILAKWIAALPPIILLACLEMVAASSRKNLTQQNVEEVALHTKTDLEVAPPSVTQVTVEEKTLYTPGVSHAATQTSQVASLSENVDGTTSVSPFDAPPEKSFAESFSTASNDVSVVDGEDATELVVDSVKDETQVAQKTPKPVVVEKSASTTSPSSKPVSRGEVLLDGVELPKDMNMGDVVKHLFDVHVQAGGDPQDPKLATMLAQKANVTPPYARRVIKPLREKMLESA